jgi:hypothetical protein
MKVTKKQTKQMFRIALFVGTIISMFYLPWILVRAWITPLPNTVQEQLNAGIK